MTLNMKYIQHKEEYDQLHNIARDYTEELHLTEEGSLIPTQQCIASPHIASPH